MPVSETDHLLEQCRLTRERSRRLREDLRVTLAQSLVLLWHSRRPKGDRSPSPELVARAERAKRNRETRLRAHVPHPAKH
jgi:hypothetical protein